MRICALMHTATCADILKRNHWSIENAADCLLPVLIRHEHEPDGKHEKQQQHERARDGRDAKKEKAQSKSNENSSGSKVGENMRECDEGPKSSLPSSVTNTRYT